MAQRKVSKHREIGGRVVSSSLTLATNRSSTYDPSIPWLVNVRGKLIMKSKALSRRTILEAGACALVAAASVPQMASANAGTGLSPKNDKTIRKWYAAWEQNDSNPVDILLT